MPRPRSDTTRRYIVVSTGSCGIRRADPDDAIRFGFDKDEEFYFSELWCHQLGSPVSTPLKRIQAWHCEKWQWAAEVPFKLVQSSDRDRRDCVGVILIISTLYHTTLNTFFQTTMTVYLAFRRGNWLWAFLDILFAPLSFLRGGSVGLWFVRTFLCANSWMRSALYFTVPCGSNCTIPHGPNDPKVNGRSHRLLMYADQEHHEILATVDEPFDLPKPGYLSSCRLPNLSRTSSSSPRNSAPRATTKRDSSVTFCPGGCAAAGNQSASAQTWIPDTLMACSAPR